MRGFAKVWMAAVAVTMIAASSTAAAQGSTAKPVAKETAKESAKEPTKPAAKPAKAENGYEYRFDDDLMKGDALGATAPRITVIKMGRRDRLLRPRLHFVPELQKSVENM